MEHVDLSLIEWKDLNRDIVLSEYSNIKIPELEFEYTSSSHKALITTVEGLLQKFASELEQEYKSREVVIFLLL